MAGAAGYDDPERWWEDVVEHVPGPAVFDALAEAETFIHTNPAETMEIAAQTFKNADASVLKAALARMEKYYAKDGKFTRGNVDRTQKISVDLKIMPQAYPYDDVVAPFAREATQ